MSETNVSDPRAEIDSIDREILSLLNRRAAIALRVGAAKVDGENSLCDPKREREVIFRLTAENPGPIGIKGIENIFQRIIDESLHLQQVAYHKPASVRAVSNTDNVMASGSKVAFLGERGTFSHEAAMHLLGEGCETVSFPTFDTLFEAVDKDLADYILTPLENTLVGSVQRCYDLLLNSDLSIAAEVILPVSHFLITGPDSDFDSIETVESHPAALSQCERFFTAYPHLKRLAADDTAGSVKRAVESGDRTRAAIGSRRAAELYGGKVLREHIEDHRDNFTRFALLSKEKPERSEADKISLVVSLKHEPGALHNALRPFVRRGIDLLKIESRPMKDDPSAFYFYLDIRPPAVEADLAGTLEELSEQTVHIRYLGRYPTIHVAQEHESF